METGTALAIGAVNQLCELLKSREVKDVFRGNGIKLEEFACELGQMKPILLVCDDLELLERAKETVYDIEDWLDEVLISPNVRRDLSFIRRFKHLKHRLCDVLSDVEDRGIVGVGDDDRARAKLMRREELCMWSDFDEIIGREAEQEALVGILLSEYMKNYDSLFVAIVGRGGIGKTALSQVVYNDYRIRREFDILCWVSVSVDWNLANILKQCLGRNNNNDRENQINISSKLMNQVRDKLKGKRFLIVLDDVWCVDPQKWALLRSCFPGDRRGSRILVTTRVQEVADAVGDVVLDAGSWDDVSLDLFQRLAFLPGEEDDDELVTIAQQVSKRCHGVSLAARVIATMFYGQNNKDTWRFLANSIQGLKNDEIMSLLAFSYQQLTPELKACFGFCSLFPKDYVIHKEVLISMWMAKGYLIPTNNNYNDQTMEQLGDEYCFLFLSRCFFHNIQRNRHAQIISFQMPHLIHDLAHLVAGKECLIVKDFNTFHPNIHRHLYIHDFSSLHLEYFTELTKSLRAILICGGYLSSVWDKLAILISECTNLRLLELSNMPLKTLPDVFDKVPFLRYLDLSNNGDLETLPASINTLHNLRVLRLCGCKNLRELPEGLGILRNLRYLNIDGCYKLVLRVPTLAMSVVGGSNYKQFNEGKFMRWESLLNFNADFLNKMGLLSPSNVLSNAERVYILEGGQDDVCMIAIKACQTIELSSRELVMANMVPGLVSLTLSHIHGLQHLMPLSQLSHLKNLHLRKLWNVECIELLPGVSKPAVFFPSLEKLVLEWMPNLKGWWKDCTWMELEGSGHDLLVDGNGHSVEQLILPSFPYLRDLSIRCCLDMTYFPPCPYVKSLELRGVNKALTFCKKRSNPTCLEELIVCYDARVFDSIVRMFVFPYTFGVNLKYFYEEQSLQIAREAFQRCATSLSYLSIDGFYNLKSLHGGGIEHLTNLQSLSIKGCSRLDLECMEVDMEEEGMPWKSLQSLSTLKLSHLPKLVNLPKAFQYLTSLQSLHIISCKNLEVLGESVCYLTSLKSLHIENCKNLKTLPECLSSLVSLQPPYITNCPKLELP